VTLGFPVTAAIETNLVGAKMGDVERENNKLSLNVDPWKIRTFEINS
jgi:hypothetical protein